MIVPGMGGPKEGEASVTAETTPHGPPSHSAIMAAQESNAMPTGPRITQAVSKARVSHRKRPSVMVVIVTRAAVGTSGVNPSSTRPAANCFKALPCDQRHHKEARDRISARTSGRTSSMSALGRFSPMS